MNADCTLLYANLREALRFFGQAHEHGDVRQLTHGLAIAAGIEYGVFNMCLLDAGAAEPVEGLREFTAYFRPRARRWSMWMCDDALPGGSGELRKALARQGLREIAVAPGMLAESLAPARRELPAIECVAVTTQALRESFGGIASVCFDVPFGVAREIYYPERGWRGSYRGYMGLVGGRPVGIVALVTTGDTVGVYSLAVEPQSRRLGYGEAILRAALAMHGPCARIVLQSSEPGESLYRRMGFREVTRFSVFLTK